MFYAAVFYYQKTTQTMLQTLIILYCANVYCTCTMLFAAVFNLLIILINRYSCLTNFIGIEHRNMDYRHSIIANEVSFSNPRFPVGEGIPQDTGTGVFEVITITITLFEFIIYNTFLFLYPLAVVHFYLYVK
jgi:hypothetical protein